MHLSQKISLGAAFFIAILILILSSMPFPSSPYKTFSYTSFVYHFGIFFFLSSFLLLAVFDSRLYGLLFFLVLVIVFFYAGLDELHQQFVLGRATTFTDLLTNFAGVLGGGVVVRIFRR